ncbi:MAG: glycosyltransferase family 39 protein [Bacteroidetes bacterium]|nr:glycosyltransferase family 39 protein [Bacteroidota bacterium]
MQLKLLFREKPKPAAVIMFVMLLLALAVRLYGIDFGKPYLYHVDEWKLVNQAGHLLDVKHLNKDVLFRLGTYPPFFTYLLAFAYGIFAVVGLVTGFFPSMSSIAEYYRTNPFTFHFIGRLICVVMGTATIQILYLAIKNLYNRKVAILSALFLAFMFIHVRNSHYSTVDIPVTFFIVTAFYFMTRIIKENKSRHYILAGVFSSLAIATKYNVVFIVVTLLLAIVFANKREKKVSLKQLFVNKKVGITAFALAFTFLVACPISWIDTGKFLPIFEKNLSSQHKGKVGLGGKDFWSYITGEQWQGFGHTSRNSMAGAMGKPIMILSLLGTTYCLLRHRRQDLLLISFPILLYVLHGNMSYKAMRHLLPALPFLVAAAAVLLDALITKWLVGFRKQHIALSLCTTVIVVPMIIDVLQYDFFLTKTDTRTLAAEWIEKNIRPGAKIAVDFYYPQVYNRNKIFSTIGPRLSKHSTIVSISDPNIDNDTVRQYELYDTNYLDFFWGPDRRIEKGPVQMITAESIEYVITDSWTSFRFYSKSALKKYPILCKQRQKYYTWVEENFNLLKELVGDEAKTPGPTIRIYKKMNEFVYCDTTNGEI